MFWNNTSLQELLHSDRSEPLIADMRDVSSIPVRKTC